MNSEKESKKSWKIKPHTFTTKILQDKRCSKGTRVVTGYVSETTDEDSLRIYLDIELKRSVEVPRHAVIHLKDMRESDDSLAPVIIWVDSSVKIRHFGNWIAPEDPTTMATGEEGGSPPTTMATGEESLGLPNPIEELINPFGQF